MDLSLSFRIPGQTEYMDLAMQVFQIEMNSEYVWQRSKVGENSSIRGCQPMNIDGIGFSLGAYTYDRAKVPTDISYFRNEYERLRKVIDKPIDRYDGRIDSKIVFPGFIADFSGLLKTHLDGTFLIQVNAREFLSVQIGSGVLKPQSRYEIDDDWTFVDTRDFHERSIHIKNNLFYPFRIAYMGTEANTTFDLIVTDTNGKEVDIFGLWEVPSIAPMILEIISIYKSTPSLTTKRSTETTAPKVDGTENVSLPEGDNGIGNSSKNFNEFY